MQSSTTNKIQPMLPSRPRGDIFTMKNQTLQLLLVFVTFLLAGLLRAADGPQVFSPVNLARASGLPISAITNGPAGLTVTTSDSSTLPADVLAWVRASADADTVLPFADVLAARIPQWPALAFMQRFTQAVFGSCRS